MSDSDKLNHLAIIIDGNRRWAKQNNLSKIEGHKVGYENLKKIALATFDKGIGYFSAFVFSTENWGREKSEVSYLMDLVFQVFTKDLKKLHEKNIKIRVLVSREHLSNKMIDVIKKAEDKTANNTAGVLCLCFNYGGRDEILQAVRKIIEKDVPAQEVDENMLKSNMYSHDIPDPDMIVRTSGEQRLSNFLLWGSAYAELSFIDIFWPDFDESWLDKVIEDYSKRSRRFGK
jgi:undecaprenyl diphosphate synthase